MKLVITTPTLKTPHGGTRNINEWAVRLSKWYDVALFVQDGRVECPWYDFPAEVKKTTSINAIKDADRVIIGSPHSIDLRQYVRRNAKPFIFMQMVEHLFNPTNVRFVRQCRDFYSAEIPFICSAKWNIDYIRERYPSSKPMYHIGTGVNFSHFPLQRGPKENIVLVEGWESLNPAKDVHAIAPRVARRLKEDGYKIIAYSQKPLRRFSNIPDEYYCQPTIKQMNELFSRAKILLKASKYDARAVAPLEAMTKGTPTARAIVKGDDDLINGYTALRVGYSESELYEISREMLSNVSLYNDLSNNCFEYIQKYDWDYWMEQVYTCLES